MSSCLFSCWLVAVAGVLILFADLTRGEILADITTYPKSTYNLQFLLASSVQLTSSNDFPCPNEQIQYACAVEGGVLEWTITPPSQSSRARSFLRGIDPLNRWLTMSWPDLSANSITVTYVAVNATHMESVANFVTTPEFCGTRIACSGLTSTYKVLRLAGKIIIVM